MARTLTKAGSDALALVAAERARSAAWSSGDRADLGMAVYQVVCALLPIGRTEVAEALAMQTAEDLDDADDAVRSVSGALLLIAAVAAARRGDNIYARATISVLLGRGRGSAGAHLRALAARSGVTP